MLTLQFTLNSLFSSFGVHSNTPYRPTSLFPTKSMIIGMLCNAIGHDWYSEKDARYPEYLSDNLKLAIVSAKEGKPFEDYQPSNFIMYERNKNTAYPKSYVYMVSKHYIVDSSFIVMIEGEDHLLHELEYFLNSPSRLLWCGRKNCALSVSGITLHESNLSSLLVSVLKDRGHVYIDGSVSLSLIKDMLDKEGFVSKTLLKTIKGGQPVSFYPKKYRDWEYYDMDIRKTRAYSDSL